MKILKKANYGVKVKKAQEGVTVKRVDNGTSTGPTKKSKVGTIKKLSDREINIAKNKEFNAYAVKKGIIPDFYKIKYGEPGHQEQIERMKEFYSNKKNLAMIDREQAKYFKEK